MAVDTRMWLTTDARAGAAHKGVWQLRDMRRMPPGHGQPPISEGHQQARQGGNAAREGLIVLVCGESVCCKV